MRGSKWIVGILCLGAAGILGATVPAVASLEYFYAKDGTITGRCVNGKIQHYSYDKKGQLTAVVDFATHEVVEQYVYDPAGNILRKTVNGRTTVYTYDKANQLVSSECNGKITKYEYDAAGRLVKEGKRSYSYSWLDKVSSVKENGVEVASFTYHMDGQIATAKANGRQENFLWDNLALISRNETEYVNEPYVTGGNPILADGDLLFNDMLGSTIGIRSGKEYRETGMTAFGETDEKSAMFTGKPYIGELGYAFLFRNYRPGLGKWQTSDPLGYPDGWNNFAYCNNKSNTSIDYFGGWSYSYIGTWTDEEKNIFESRMFSAFRAMLSVMQQLQRIYDAHVSHICNCIIHNYTSGISTTIQILRLAMNEYQSSATLDIIKADLGSIAGAYAGALPFIRDAYMKVNIAEGSSYNFFTGMPQSTIRTCIHEITHAGGSEDYLDGNGGIIQRWDNAHVIEDIGLLGVGAFKGIVDLTKCECE